MLSELDPNPAQFRDRVEATIGRAAQALYSEQKPDGHWVYELEADATIPAEYVLLRHYLGEPVDAALEAKIGTYLRRRQSTKAYYALKMIGDDIAAPHMARARAAIHRAGGAEAGNVFTRIQLALFGAGPWDAVPTIPPELILAPRWFPIHLSKMSYWARTVVVPLLVLCALKPKARNPKGVLVDELFIGKPARLNSQADDVRWYWSKGFHALDVVLKAGDKLWPKSVRDKAIRRRVGHRAAQRRGRPRRDLSGDGQFGDDVRRPRLCGGPSGAGDRAQIAR
jgi:squalene-hopene/tetraprenyl-beta-curcumene cyclase